MVWEVVTPAVLSGDPERHSGRYSEPEDEHAGKPGAARAAQ